MKTPAILGNVLTADDTVLFIYKILIIKQHHFKTNSQLKSTFCSCVDSESSRIFENIVIVTSFK